MTIQWADDFSRYGTGSTSNTRMKDGLPYNNWEGQCFVDPDPVEAAKGLRVAGLVDAINNNGYVGNRIALTTPTAGTVGVTGRYWFNEFTGSGFQHCIAAWAPLNPNNANYPDNIYATVAVENNGAISIRGGSRGEYAPLATTGGPVISTNSWNHIESSYNGTSGDIEVRLNGNTILTATSPKTGTIYFAMPKAGIGYSGTTIYVKDLIIWDDSGATDNTFFGTVSCIRLTPNSDITLGGWTLSGGTTGYDLLADTRPANVFTATGQLDPDGTEFIRIDNIYYRPTTGSVDAGSPAGTSANPWRVALGVDAAASLLNLFQAINGTGTPGTTYSTALTVHPTVTGKGYSATQLLITSNDGVTKTYECDESMAQASWASSSMTLIGPQDLSYMSADDTPPAAMEFGFTDLPPDVTSVRGLVVVGRMKKIDGGDGNVQMSLISNGSAFDGADRPLTTTDTYWYDISQLDPDTGLPWSPLAVNNMTGRINRTV